MKRNIILKIMNLIVQNLMWLFLISFLVLKSLTLTYAHKIQINNSMGGNLQVWTQFSSLSRGGSLQIVALLRKVSQSAPYEAPPN